MEKLQQLLCCGTSKQPAQLEEEPKAPVLHRVAAQLDQVYAPAWVRTHTRSDFDAPISPAVDQPVHLQAWPTALHTPSTTRIVENADLHMLDHAHLHSAKDPLTACGDKAVWLDTRGSLKRGMQELAHVERAQEWSDAQQSNVFVTVNMLVWNPYGYVSVYVSQACGEEPRCEDQEPSDYCILADDPPMRLAEQADLDDALTKNERVGPGFSSVHTAGAKANTEHAFTGNERIFQSQFRSALESRISYIERSQDTDVNLESGRTSTLEGAFEATDTTEHGLQTTESVGHTMPTTEKSDTTDTDPTGRELDAKPGMTSEIPGGSTRVSTASGEHRTSDDRRGDSAQYQDTEKERWMGSAVMELESFSSHAEATQRLARHFTRCSHPADAFYLCSKALEEVDGRSANAKQNLSLRLRVIESICKGLHANVISADLMQKLAAELGAGLRSGLSPSHERSLRSAVYNIFLLKPPKDPMLHTPFIEPVYNLVESEVTSAKEWTRNAAAGCLCTLLDALGNDAAEIEITSIGARAGALCKNIVGKAGSMHTPKGNLLAAAQKLVSLFPHTMSAETIRQLAKSALKDLNAASPDDRLSASQILTSLMSHLEMNIATQIANHAWSSRNLLSSDQNEHVRDAGITMRERIERLATPSAHASTATAMYSASSSLSSEVDADTAVQGSAERGNYSEDELEKEDPEAEQCDKEGKKPAKLPGALTSTRVRANEKEKDLLDVLEQAES